MRHIGGIEHSGILQIRVKREEVLAQVLRALQVLQDPRQLFTPGLRLGVVPRAVIKDDNFIDGKDGGGARNLSRQIGPQLPSLGIVQHRAGQGNAHSVLASLSQTELFYWFLFSVADPDPYVFGPPESISRRYGSRSFYLKQK
jgi:hypothetical protein